MIQFIDLGHESGSDKKEVFYSTFTGIFLHPFILLSTISPSICDAGNVELFLNSLHVVSDTQSHSPVRAAVENRH